MNLDEPTALLLFLVFVLLVLIVSALVSDIIMAIRDRRRAEWHMQKLWDERRDL